MKRRRNLISHTEILEKALAGEALSRGEIRCLLNSCEGKEADDLFRVARRLKNRHFGNKLFLYGFVYTSTFCRNNCSFCYYRKDNENSIRYKKKRSEIIDISARLADSGVHLIDLTMGEAAEINRLDSLYFHALMRTISEVKKKTGLPVMISPGVVPEKALPELSQAGADWYAVYQETHSKKLFSELRPGQCYDERFEIKKKAKTFGMMIEEGILCGAGESIDDILDSFDAIRELDADQTRVMGFVPQKGTPMERYQRKGNQLELIILAIMRLLFPNRLIPASLDVEGSGGLEMRLSAGANVVTSIIPAGDGLAGVAQNSLNIEDAGRTVAYIRKKLALYGKYEIAGPNEFIHYMTSRKNINTLPDKFMRGNGIMKEALHAV